MVLARNKRVKSLQSEAVMFVLSVITILVGAAMFAMGFIFHWKRVKRFLEVVRANNNHAAIAEEANNVTNGMGMVILNMFFGTGIIVIGLVLMLVGLVR